MSLQLKVWDASLDCMHKSIVIPAIPILGPCPKSSVSIEYNRSSFTDVMKLKYEISAELQAPQGKVLLLCSQIEPEQDRCLHHPNHRILVETLILMTKPAKGSTGDTSSFGKKLTKYESDSKASGSSSLT